MKQEELVALIAHIQRKFLTSHNIVNRIHYPVYHSQDGIPELLTKFKRRINTYREKAVGFAVAIGKEKGALFTASTPSEYSDIIRPTFAQQLVASLAVSDLGIGECAECASVLAVELIKAGEKSIAFISIKFIRASANTEQGHQFIIANLPNHANPLRFTPNMSIQELFQAAPSGAMVVDAFLELCFSPNDIPELFQQYLDAYGGAAEVMSGIHLFNFQERNLRPYLDTAAVIRSRLVEEVQQREQEQDFLADKIVLDAETVLIAGLNSRKKSLRFFGVRDVAYKVDAVAYIGDDVEEKDAIVLQQDLKGLGLFFMPSTGKRYFVIEGINLPEGKPSIGERVQNYLKHK